MATVIASPTTTPTPGAAFNVSHSMPAASISGPVPMVSSVHLLPYYFYGNPTEFYIAAHFQSATPMSGVLELRVLDPGGAELFRHAETGQTTTPFETRTIYAEWMGPSVPAPGVYTVSLAARAADGRLLHEHTNASAFTLVTSPVGWSDTFENAVSISVPSYLTGDTRGRASDEPGQPEACYGWVSDSIWFRVTAPRSGTLVVSARESERQSLLGIYHGTSLAGLQELACNSNRDGADLSVARASVKAGETYYIQLQTAALEYGSSFTLRTWFEDAPPNDSIESALPLALPSRVRGNSEWTTMDLREPVGCDWMGRTLWYRVDPTTSGTLVVETAGSDYQPTLAVYAGTTLRNLHQIGCRSWRASDEPVAVPVVAGERYYVQVGGGGSSLDSGAVAVSVSLRPASSSTATSTPTLTPTPSPTPSPRSAATATPTQVHEYWQNSSATRLAISSGTVARGMPLHLWASTYRYYPHVSPHLGVFIYDAEWRLVWSDWRLDLPQSGATWSDATFTWVPAVGDGTYHVSLGLFRSDWVGVLWHHNAATIVVRGGVGASYATITDVMATDVQEGDSVRIKMKVSSAHGGTVHVGTYVYDSEHRQVWVGWKLSERFAAGEVRDFEVTWPVGAYTYPQTYSVGVGVFSADWSTTHHWDFPAASVSGTRPAKTQGGFTSRATAHRSDTAAVHIGASVTSTSTSTSTSASASTVHVGVYVFDSEWRELGARGFLEQTFSAGETRAYAYSWTPSAGDYGFHRVAIAVFSHDWSEVIHWYPQAATFEVL
jgi:hypothetical protein